MPRTTCEFNGSGFIYYGENEKEFNESKLLNHNRLYLLLFEEIP
jgi:hypothetical protein